MKTGWLLREFSSWLFVVFFTSLLVILWLFVTFPG
jgi:hypothetical protein